MITVADDGFDGALDGGLLVCPGCGGRLIRWGWDAPRAVRGALDRFAPVSWVRRRRVRCKGCGVTHVVQRQGLVARHRDAGSVIRAALDQMAAGFGFRRAADVVDRAVSTVRGWYRAAARGDAWVAGLAASGV